MCLSVSFSRAFLTRVVVRTERDYFSLEVVSHILALHDRQTPTRYHERHEKHKKSKIREAHAVNGSRSGMSANPFCRVLSPSSLLFFFFVRRRQHNTTQAYSFSQASRCSSSIHCSCCLCYCSWSICLHHQQFSSAR